MYWCNALLDMYEKRLRGINFFYVLSTGDNHFLCILTDYVISVAQATICFRGNMPTGDPTLLNKGRNAFWRTPPEHKKYFYFPQVIFHLC